MRMIDEVGGGMRGGKKLKAVIPGGSSCPVLKAEECDLRHGLRFAGQSEEHAGLGRRGRDGRKHLHGEGRAAHHAILRARKLRLVHSLPRGHHLAAQAAARACTTAWGSASDIDLIGDLAKNMLGRTFCPLGDAAAMPTISFVEKFRDEFEAHLDGKPCPYEEAGRLVTA